MRSMTGMGTGQARKGKLTLRVEIRAVNHRFLDLVFRLPAALADFETRLRNRLSAEIDRGRITVNVEMDRAAPELELRINEPFVEAWVKAARKLARRHGLREDLGVSDLAALPEAFTVREKAVAADLVQELMDKALDQALGRFDRMRQAEGKSLGRELSSRLKRIENEVATVRRYAESVPRELRRKLEDRLARLGAADAVDPSRLAAEVALLADRATISEEIERLESHLSQFRHALKTGGPVAKRLGFLLQEMHREVNTTGSKTNDLRITDAVLRMKEELENMREQIQNLE